MIVIQPGDKSPMRPDRHQFGDGRGPDLVGQPHLLADILEEYQTPFGSDLEPVEHLCRGQDMRDPALVDRGIDQALAGRVVEVDRYFTPERDGEIGHGGGHRRRYQQPDVFGGPPGSRQDAAQGQRADERLAICQARRRCYRPWPRWSSEPGPGPRGPWARNAMPPARAAGDGAACKGLTRDPRQTKGHLTVEAHSIPTPENEPDAMEHSSGGHRPVER